MSSSRQQTLARERDERQKKAREDQTKKVSIARRMIEGAHPAAADDLAFLLKLAKEYGECAPLTVKDFVIAYAGIYTEGSE